VLGNDGSVGSVLLADDESLGTFLARPICDLVKALKFCSVSWARFGRLGEDSVKDVNGSLSGGIDVRGTGGLR
jgi:hypothetical protein